MFNNEVGNVLVELKNKFPISNIYIYIYIESYNETPYAWYIQKRLPNPYSIDYKTDHLEFELPNPIILNGIYVLKEDYAHMDNLYKCIEGIQLGFIEKK